ncbi:FKBP-type peptidyl-prolyl cis-trans isomerase [Ferruginibacter sp.]
MKQSFNVAVICLLTLAACTTPFKKAKDGSQYKIISVKKGPKLVTGNFMEMSVVAKYKDSLLYSTADEGMPQYGLYDTANFPIPFKEIFKNVHVGDSIILKVSTDTLIAKGQSAPFMKKGQFLYQMYTITNVFQTKEQVDSVQKIYVAAVQKKDSLLAIEQTAKDNKSIDSFLTKTNVTNAVKSPKGTYVQILDPGTGNTPDSSQVLLVNYTGKTFAGETFDSNTDSAFQHVEPYPVNMAAPQVIPGWVDGLKMLKKGAKAKFFVPSGLAYGKRGSGDKIKPNQNLVFDISIADILTQAQYTDMMKKRQEQEIAKQKAMEELQKQLQQQGQSAAPVAPKK